MPSETTMFAMTVLCALLGGAGIGAALIAILWHRQRTETELRYGDLVERAAARAAARLVEAQRRAVGSATMDNITGAYAAGQAAERRSAAAPATGSAVTGDVWQSRPMKQAAQYAADEPGPLPPGVAAIDGQRR